MVITLIIAMGREDRFLVPIADSMAFAAEDYGLTKNIFSNFSFSTPQIVVAPDIIMETFGSILRNFPK